MDETRLQQKKRLIKQLDIDRSTWVPHWRELSEYVEPRQSRFLITNHNQGGKKNNKIVDNSATLALRTLRSGMMSGITSPARPWFQLGTPDEELNEYGPVKEWLHEAAKRMRTIFARSNLYNTLPMIYGHMGLNGVAAMPVMEDIDKIIHTQASPIGSYWLSVNDKQTIDVYAREMIMTVRQLVMKFGDQQAGPKDRWANFSQTVQDAWHKGNYETQIPVMHIVQPNEMYDPDRLSSKYKRFSSCYYEKNSTENKFLRESGYDENPVICPRWDVTGEDVYGSSPGMEALGDIKALQLLQKRKSQAIEKQIKPPMVAPPGMEKKRLSTIAGDVTFVDSRNNGEFKPAHEVRLDLNPVLEDITEHQQRIKRAFYEDLFLMLAQSDRREITAREIEERHEEKLLALGPVLERLNNELLDPIIDRTFSIMLKREMLPPPPPELQGIDLRVEYISIMAQAQKMVGLSSMDRFMRFAGGMMEAVPNAVDKIDTDQAIDDYADMTGVSPKIVRTDEQVAQIREQRAQQERAAQMAEQAQQLSGTAKTLSETEVKDDNALTRMLSGIAGGG